MKVLIVIGASKGIGRATALALADSGSHLVLAARDGVALEQVAAEVRARGAEATAVPCDATAEPHVRRLIDTAAGVSGRIDVLVNSAGGAVVAPLEELTLADWEQSLRVGLTSVFLTCKHAARHMPQGGLIVNVASVAARQHHRHADAARAQLLADRAREAQQPVLRGDVGRPGWERLPAATDTALWDALPGEWNRANMLRPEDVGRAIAQLAAQPAYMATEEIVVGHVAGRL